MGISKTFGIGKESSASSGQGNRRGGDGSGAARSPIGLGGIGGRGLRGGGGRGGAGSGDGGGDTGKRYNLTFSINIQNPLNHANLGRPDGNLSSPSFGLSTSSAGNFGGFGSAPGSSAYDRRIDAQIRFSF